MWGSAQKSAQNSALVSEQLKSSREKVNHYSKEYSKKLTLCWNAKERYRGTSLKNRCTSNVLVERYIFWYVDSTLAKRRTIASEKERSCPLPYLVCSWGRYPYFCRPTTEIWLVWRGWLWVSNIKLLSWHARVTSGKSPATTSHGRT